VRNLPPRHKLVCLLLIVIVPVSLLCQDSAPAILRSSGGVLLNRNPVPASSAIFPNDLIEVPKNAMARIEATGSSADINAESVVQYNADELVLEHGSLSVNTSRGLRVRVGCVTVTPVNSADWTRYDVADMDGKVTVSALKNDVYLNAHSNNPQQAKQSGESGRTIVREGDQKSREEKCGGADIKQQPNMAGDGAILNSPYVQWPAVGIVIGITCWALCRSGEPLSPAMPK
jgi:hypothetical protein